MGNSGLGGWKRAKPRTRCGRACGGCGGADSALRVVRKRLQLAVDPSSRQLWTFAPDAVQRADGVRAGQAVGVSAALPPQRPQMASTRRRPEFPPVVDSRSIAATPQNRAQPASRHRDGGKPASFGAATCETVVSRPTTVRLDGVGGETVGLQALGLRDPPNACAARPSRLPDQPTRAARPSAWHRPAHSWLTVKARMAFEKAIRSRWKDSTNRAVVPS
jgi:hypothetical protein